VQPFPGSLVQPERPFFEDEETMNKLLPIIVAVVAAGGLTAAGCTVNSTTNNNGGDAATGDDSSVGDDGGNNTDTGVETDTGTPADGGTEAAAPSAFVRLANWSPDSPTAGYDFCVAAHGTTTFEGPQLAAATSSDAGAGLTLGFPTVTTYFEIDPGTYDIEIVAGNATDCTTPVGTANTSILTGGLTANNYYTIAIVGDTTVAGSDPAITTIGFQDDPAPTAGGVNVRFLNAAPSLNGTTTADFGTGALGASSFVGLESAVAFATLPTANAADDAGTVDSNGYIGTAAFASATEFSAHTTTGGNSDTATVSGVTIAANTSATLILINGKTGGAAASFLVCQGDTTTSTTSLLSSCSNQ
jgi:hypothetical protein